MNNLTPEQLLTIIDSDITEVNLFAESFVQSVREDMMKENRVFRLEILLDSHKRMTIIRSFDEFDAENTHKKMLAQVSRYQGRILSVCNSIPISIPVKGQPQRIQGINISWECAFMAIVKSILIYQDVIGNIKLEDRGDVALETLLIPEIVKFSRIYHYPIVHN